MADAGALPADAGALPADAGALPDVVGAPPGSAGAGRPWGAAARVVATGYLLAPRGAGASPRVVLLIAARDPRGAPDRSWDRLSAAAAGGLRAPGGGWRTPLEPEPRADALGGTVGRAYFTLPDRARGGARRRAHWLATAAALRGRWVRVEALVRRYSFSDERGATVAGVAFDLVDLAEPA